MTDTVENLILDLLEWVGRRERTYQETMEAWRTSCPKLPVWEDANDRGLVDTAFANGRSLVCLTPAGLALLKERRPHAYEGFCAFPRKWYSRVKNRLTRNQSSGYLGSTPAEFVCCLSLREKARPFAKRKVTLL